MRVLILGGYGLIGLALTRALHAAGHRVTALGRSATLGQRLFPSATWLAADIPTQSEPARWQPYLADIDVVINASGVLQDSARDRVADTQHIAIAALVTACESKGIKRFIQISAPGALEHASTEFMRSKARADTAIKASALDWVILRPGVVIGENAYGGSALFRMLAAMPLIQPLALAEQKIQTVAMHDVTRIALQAVDGTLPRHTDVDLVEAESHTLREVVEHFRVWLGFTKPLMRFHVAYWVVRGVAKVADLLGLLGWRSPLRSTAIRALRDDVIGNAAPLHALTGGQLLSLQQTLESLPATLQERWFARLYLLMPIVIATLAGFWLLSGAIGLGNIERAAATIPPAVLGHDQAAGLVVAGGIIDLLLGAAVLCRPWAQRACLGMIAVSAVYLAFGSVLTPQLWADPLGPFVKVLPSILLAAVALILLENR